MTSNFHYIYWYMGISGSWVILNRNGVNLMACSLSSFCCFNQVFSSHRIMFPYPRMRSQSFRDNGKHENSVDSNLSVLRERIRRIRKRERLIDRRGWNYKHDYGHECKRSNHDNISEFAEIAGITCGAIGLVFLFGSLCIFLVSLLVFIFQEDM